MLHSHNEALVLSPSSITFCSVGGGDSARLRRSVHWSRWLLLIGLLCYIVTQVTDAAPSVNEIQRLYDDDQGRNQLPITPDSVTSIRLKRRSADAPHHRHHHHHRRRAVEPEPTMRSARRAQNTPASSEGIDPDDGVFTRYGGRR